MGTDGNLTGFHKYPLDQDASLRMGMMNGGEFSDGAGPIGCDSGR